MAKVQGANRSFLAGYMRDAGKTLQVAAGQTLSGVPDIGLLLITTRDGRPVYVRDVAKVHIDTLNTGLFNMKIFVYRQTKPAERIIAATKKEL